MGGNERSVTANGLWGIRNEILVIAVQLPELKNCYESAPKKAPESYLDGCV